MPPTKHVDVVKTEQSDLGWTSTKEVERGTVRVKCLANEHDTMSPARTQTRGPFLERPGNLTGPKSYS